MLLAAAAPKEAEAVLRGVLGAKPSQELSDLREASPAALATLTERIDLVVTGVGKVNAAAAVLTVVDPARHAAVVNLGVAGSLPGSGLEIGQAVAATASVYADEGLEADDGYRTLEELGFPLGPFPGGSVPADPHVLAWLRTAATAIGPIATVSTCSGTDARAAAVRERTAAVAEAMEGAAIGHALIRRFGSNGPRFGELRVISNRTGRREDQGWNLGLALERLSEVAAHLAMER